MKLLHFSDLHLGMENYGHIDPETGLSKRFSDWQRALQQIIAYANDYDVDAVLFTGDAFKNRDPSPTYQNAFAKAIKALSHNRHVILLVGNHDLPNIENKAHTLEIYNSLDLPRVIVSKKIEKISIETRGGPLQIITWPWLTRNHFLKNEELKGKSLEEIDSNLLGKALHIFEQHIHKLDEKIPSIAMVHATVMGATFGSERNVMIGKDLIIPLHILLNKKLSYSACGHLHKHQILSTDPYIAYAGSLERIDFGEEGEEKGCILIDIDGTKKVTTTFLPLRVREFITWRIEKKLVPPPKNLKDAIVRIIISGDKNFVNSITIHEVQEFLHEVYYFAGIERNILNNETEKNYTREKSFAVNKNPEEQLNKYLVHKEYKKVIQEKVLKAAEFLFSSTKNT